jgi:hypothetical protein
LMYGTSYRRETRRSCVNGAFDPHEPPACTARMCEGSPGPHLWEAQKLPEGRLFRVGCAGRPEEELEEEEEEGKGSSAATSRGSGLTALIAASRCSASNFGPESTPHPRQLQASHRYGRFAVQPRRNFSHFVLVRDAWMRPDPQFGQLVTPPDYITGSFPSAS